MSTPCSCHPLAHATLLSALLLLLPVPSQPQGFEQPRPEKQTNQINSLHQIASYKSSPPRRALQKKKCFFFPADGQWLRMATSHWPGGPAGTFVTVCRSSDTRRADGKSIRRLRAAGLGDPLRQDLLLDLPSSSLFLCCFFVSPSCFLWCRIGFDSIFLRIALQPAWRSSTTSPSPVVMSWSHPGTSWGDGVIYGGKNWTRRARERLGAAELLRHSVQRDLLQLSWS